VPRARQVQHELPATLRDLERRLVSLEAKAVRPAAARPLGRGVVRQQVLDTAPGDYTTTTTTDMTLTNVPVVAGRLYAVHLHVRWTFASIAAAARWVLDFHVNGGTRLDTFDDIQFGQTGTYRGLTDSTLFWTPAVTAETDDLTIVATEATDGATLGLEATSTTLRTLTLSDWGKLT